MNYAGAGLLILSPDFKQILLVHDARSRKWGFPKGHRESFDASDLATAVREVGEETGLTLEDYTVYPDVFKISKGSQSYLFRYAVLKHEKNKQHIKAGPSYEISDICWTPLQQLLTSNTVLDGNKYLRTWISDIQSDSPKKPVYLFKSLLASLQPPLESVSTNNVVTCS